MGLRVFVAVDPPSEVRSLLGAMLAELPEPIPGRAVPPSNWHLTLRFLGDCDEVTIDRLMAELDQIDLGGPFPLELRGLGAFPNRRRATVLWVGVGRGASELETLAASDDGAAEAIGFEPEDRPFRPHLTISRIRPDEDVGRLLDTAPPMPVRWEVGELVVYRSYLGGGAARYQALESFPLG